MILKSIFLSLILFSQLVCDDKLSNYTIEVGAYDNADYAQKIKNSFDIYQPSIEEVEGYYVVQIKNIKTKKDAQNVLVDIQVVENKAFIKNTTIIRRKKMEQTLPIETEISVKDEILEAMLKVDTPVVTAGVKKTVEVPLIKPTKKSFSLLDFVQNISLEKNENNKTIIQKKEEKIKPPVDPILDAMMEQDTIAEPISPEPSESVVLTKGSSQTSTDKEKFTLYNYFSKKLSDINSSKPAEKMDSMVEVIPVDQPTDIVAEKVKAVKPLADPILDAMLKEPAKISNDKEKFTLYNYLSKKVNDINTSEQISNIRPLEIIEDLNLSFVSKDVNITMQQKITDSMLEITPVEEQKKLPEFTQPKINDLDGNEKQAITFYRAIMNSINTNPTVRASFERLTQASLKIGEVRSGYYPQGTASATSEYYKKDQEITGKDDYVKHFGNVKLKQMIYDGGKLKNNLKHKEFEKDVNDYKYQNVIEVEVLKAAKAYLDVVFNKMSLKINRQNMRKLQDILKIAKTKKELGAVSEGDIASVETSVTNAKSGLIKIESKYYDSILFYNHFVENDNDTNLPFEYKFDTSLLGLKSYVDATLNRNFEIRSLEAKIESSRSKYESYRGTLQPTLDFQLSSDKTLYIGTVTENEINHIAGLKFGYQFLDGGKSKNRKESLRSEIMRQTYKLNEAKRDLAWDATKLYSSIVSSEKTNESIKAEIAAASKMVGSYWQKYKLASQELDILISAQRQLNNAQIAYVKSLSTGVYGYFKLLSTNGELLEYIQNNLSDDTEYYDITIQR